MSDFDEIDDYGAVEGTPFKPIPGPAAKKRKTAPSSTTGRAIAGPSRNKAVSDVGATKRRAIRAQEPKATSDNDDEIEALDGPPPTRASPPINGTRASKPKGKQPEVPVTNGKAQAKGKGKEKADPPPKSKASKKASTPVPIVLSDGDDPQPSKPAPVLKNGKKSTTASSSEKTTASTRTLVRLQKQLDEVTSHRDAVIKQFEELQELRQTSQEEEIQRCRAQYESALRAKEGLVEELTAHIARIEPMLKPGRAPYLRFLTREAADKEQQAKQKEIDRLNQVISDQQAQLDEREEHYKVLEAQLRDTRAELTAEINRGKELVALKPARNPPGTVHTHSDPKTGFAITLYEDITNLLITNLRVQPSQVEDVPADDLIYTCVYTHPLTKLSLNFILEVGYKLENNTDHVALMGMHKPVGIENESEDFKQRLGYYSDVISFHYDQVDVYMKEIEQCLSPDEQDADPEQLPGDESTT
ncbi:hypothetical protein OF83DRAFT_1177414 [Amylostereum chailletii]|nr:hypothetical protein OF83DRAFT_1177414 [Amylostereum chailletii]